VTPLKGVTSVSKEMLLPVTVQYGDAPKLKSLLMTQASAETT